MTETTDIRYFLINPIDRFQQISTVGWYKMINGNFLFGGNHINLVASPEKIIKRVVKALLEREDDAFMMESYLENNKKASIEEYLPNDTFYYNSIVELLENMLPLSMDAKPIFALIKKNGVEEWINSCEFDDRIRHSEMIKYTEEILAFLLKHGIRLDH